MTPSLPLEGIRVLDLSTFLSGPLLTRALADLGAEVIKVEPPTGDPTRAGSGMAPGQPASPFWMALHRDRQSVVVDLKTSAGRQVLLDLLGAVDVLVDNFRPGVLDRLGLSPAEVAADHPRLVHCSITGFGPDGPMADQVSIDGPVQAFAGLVDLSASVGLGRRPAPLTVADIAGAAAASQALLAALLRRERTGLGCRVEVSLYEALLQWLTLADRTGTLAPPTTQVLDTADGRAVLVQTPMHFQARLLALVAETPGFEDAAGDARFTTAEGVRAAAADYREMLERAFATRPAAEWLERLRSAGIPAGLVQSIDAALAHPQLDHRAARITIHADDRDEVVLAPPYTFDGTRRTDTVAPPTLGQHTAAALRRLLGYDDDVLDRLAAEGAFGPAR